MSGKHWYVVHTQPQSEVRAEANLARQGFSTYLPRVRRTRRHARRTELVTKALFPRYLFVSLDLARDRWRSVQSTFGVSGLLAAGEEPIPVPTGVVDDIRAREDGDGYVALGLPAGVVPGSKVKLLDSAFAECSGILERITDDRRVAVLMQLLGRKVRVFVPVTSIGTG